MMHKLQLKRRKPRARCKSSLKLQVRWRALLLKRNSFYSNGRALWYLFSPFVLYSLIDRQLGLEKRDEALHGKEAAIGKLREELMVMDAEAAGYKAATKVEQDKNEQLTQILNKATNEIDFLDKKIAGINEKRDKLTQEFSQLQRVLDHTEAELSKVMMVCAYNYDKNKHHY